MTSLVPESKAILQGVGGVDLADRVAQVRGVGGAAAGAIGECARPVARVMIGPAPPRITGLPRHRCASRGCVGQIARRVERDPAVQANHHEREERLVELALGIAAGGIAQVEPDRVGDAVAVVIDVVGDLAGGRVGEQVGEGGGVVAVGGDRTEDSRRRSRASSRWPAADRN